MSEDQLKFLCPTCGQEIQDSEPFWIWRTKFYCDESCTRVARKAVGHFSYPTNL